ncbi:MAG: hypothetical protein JXA96_04765 [Sedimentisphaerales bacterium]|nr:hypothetical protein [Sedimentisphaerales bacterium]
MALICLTSACQPERPMHKVVYKVKSTSGSVAVAYTQLNGEKSDMVEVKTPWTKTLSFRNTVVYLLVANPNEYGDISCEILLDGKSLKFEESKYPNDKVACALFIP